MSEEHGDFMTDLDSASVVELLDCVCTLIWSSKIWIGLEKVSFSGLFVKISY